MSGVFVCGSLFVVRCELCVAGCVLVVCRWLSSVVCWMGFNGCCLTVVIRCPLFDVCCSLRCFLRLLFVACCLLFVNR